MILGVAIGCARHESPAPAAATKPATEREARPASGVEPRAGSGSAMPAYQATLLDGKTFDVAAERGNVVFLNLWATWCGPCRSEIPELQALHDQYAARGFKVVGVSLDDSGVDGVRKFVKDHKMTYPVAVDAEGKLGTLLETNVLPTSVLLDRSGRIVWKQLGMVSTTDPEFATALQRALDAKPAGPSA